MREFNLEEAKQGKPVCTRDGRPARIICFDKNDAKYPLVALIDNGITEDVYSLTKEGRWLVSEKNNNDLFMIDEKHIGYVNIYNMESSGPC